MAYLQMDKRRRRRIWRHLVEIVECAGRALAEFQAQNDTDAGDYVDALHTEAGLLLNELGEAKREIGYERPHRRHMPDAPAPHSTLCRIYDWVAIGSTQRVKGEWMEGRGPSCERRIGRSGYFYMDLVPAVCRERVHIYSVDSTGQPDGVIDRRIRVPRQPLAHLSDIPEVLPKSSAPRGDE